MWAELKDRAGELGRKERSCRRRPDDRPLPPIGPSPRKSFGRGLTGRGDKHCVSMMRFTVSAVFTISEADTGSAGPLVLDVDALLSPSVRSFEMLLLLADEVPMDRLARNWGRPSVR